MDSLVGLFQGLCGQRPCQPASKMRVLQVAIREDIVFLYCRVQKRVGGGWTPWYDTHKKKLCLRKNVIEKHTEEVKLDQKVVLDLAESMMKLTDPVKEKLRRKTMTMNQFIQEIHYFRVCTFWMSGKLTDSRRRPTRQASLVSLKPTTAPQTQNKSIKNRTLARQGHYPSASGQASQCDSVFFVRLLATLVSRSQNWETLFNMYSPCICFFNGVRV